MLASEEALPFPENVIGPTQDSSGVVLEVPEIDPVAESAG